MSLTSFLKQSKDVRALLQAHFPYPLKSVFFPPLKAVPLTTNYAMVGQAFDYLLRFYMQRHNPDAPRRSPWVANLIKATLSGDGEEVRQQKEVEAAALPFLEQAHLHHEHYLEDGKITDALLGSCLDLAIIDGLVRAGEVRGILGQKDARDIRDLRNLLALIPATPFVDGNPCTLNPAFSFPGGADCDLLIGDTLIEIKTTKFAELKQEYFQQLLGYYLLTLEKARTQPIQHLGVYFSRHGFLWSVAIKDIGSLDAFFRFLPLWNEQVASYYERTTLRHEQEKSASAPTHTLEDLISQVNALPGPSSYMNWLSQLSHDDFTLWKSYDASPYFLAGAIEHEQERRDRRRTVVVTSVD